MKKRLKKKLERKDMSNRQLVKFLNGVVLRQNKRIEEQKSTLEKCADRIIKRVKENIEVESQNRVLARELSRAHENIKLLKEEINELQVKPWWKKAIQRS